MKRYNLFWLSMLAIFLFIGCAPKNQNSLHYTVSVKIEPETGQISGTATIDNPPDSCFYINEHFTIISVTTHGKPLPFQRIKGDYLPYTIGSPVEMGKLPDNRVEIEYSGTITDTINGVNMIGPELVELAIYAAWYPAFKSSTPFEYELNIDLPAGLIVTTNGVIEHEETKSGRHITQWKSHNPGTDMAIIASPQLRKLQTEQNGTNIELFYKDLPKDYVLSKNDYMMKAMQRFTDYYGPLHAKGLLRFIDSPRGGWGYSRVPLFIVPEQYAFYLLDQEFGKEQDIHGAVHELAHFWWLIADANTTDDWLNEGLAEFSAFRFSRESFGDAFAEYLAAQYREHAAQSQPHTPIAETTTGSNDRYVNRYEKMTLIYIEA